MISEYREKSIAVERAILNFNKQKVLVIGDIMLDQYTYGTVTRISQEAPVPVVKKTKETFVPGGAGNVANNIASLGAKATLVGVIGKDLKGKTLLALLKHKKINASNVVALSTKPTIVKERIVSGNNQLLRIDQEDTRNLTIAEEKQLLNLVRNEIGKCDAVILADYAKGLFSKTFTKEVINLAKKNKKKIIVDLKPQNKNYFKGAYVVAPNFKEAQELTGLAKLTEIGRKLVKDLGSNVVITRGEEGMSIFRDVNDKGIHLPAKKIRILFDVTGAGDTVCAVLALGLAFDLDLIEAAMLANNAASIVVQKPGTATLSVSELKESLKTDSENFSHRP